VRELFLGRDGHCADPVSLAQQVHQHPAAVTLLDVLRLERRELAPPRSAQPKSTARIARSRFFSMVSIVGLSEQVARLFA
jgi:hypothetical protein